MFQGRIGHSDGNAQASTTPRATVVPRGVAGNPRTPFLREAEPGTGVRQIRPVLRGTVQGFLRREEGPAIVGTRSVFPGDAVGLFRGHRQRTWDRVASGRLVEFATVPRIWPRVTHARRPSAS